MLDLNAAVASQEVLERGERRFRRNITGALGVGIVVLVVLAATAMWFYGRERSYSVWVDHTYAAEARVSRIATVVERLETARRGYLISPQPTYWRTYADVRDRLGPMVDDFAVFTSDNPRERAYVARLRALLASKRAQLRDSIELAHTGDMAGGRRNFLDQQRLEVTQKLRDVLAAMSQEERRLLATREGDEQRNAIGLLVAILGASVLLAAIGGGSVLLVRRYSTELQRAQTILRGMNAGLEQAVEERTVDLKRANEEIQRFAYIVSHDLRSPLVNIMGFTSELEAALPALHRMVAEVQAQRPELVTREARDVIDAELPESIDFIRKSTSKMDRLINAILKLSREGRRNLTPEPLDMDALVAGVAGSLKQLAESRGAQIGAEPGIPDLVSDRVAVEQVISNLVENAVKYLKPGRPGRVTVRGRTEAGRVLYEVQDNGRGVDPKDHERIFDLFRRSGAQDQPGEGIGLAHVRALVYRLGGVIACDSALDQGATFRVSLPAQPLREEARPA